MKVELQWCEAAYGQGYLFFFIGGAAEAEATTGEVDIATPVAADCGDTEVSAERAGVGSCATIG